MATFNERLARAFMEQDHQVSIFTFSLQYPSFLFPGKTQYSSEPAPVDLDIRVRVNSVNPLNWLKVGHEIAKLRPDLLIIRYWMPFMAPSLGTIARRVRKNGHTRVIAITDNVLPHEKQPGVKWLTRYFLRSNDAFICMSSSVRKDLLKMGAPEHSVGVCPHPLYDNFGETVDASEARQKLKLPKDQKLVLFFGFIRAYKGLDLLLQAFAREEIRNMPVKLLVAGECYDDAAKYHQMVNSLGIAEQLIWHNHFIPNDQVRLYFSAADLVVQPYKSATQSGVTQVAYHFDKPMVVSNVGGLPEMVSHGRSAYVVEPEASAIADAMADFFIHGREKQMIPALREEKKRFSWDRLVESLLQAAGMEADKAGKQDP